MRESPVTSLIKLPWWISLLIGLGMLAFGELLKMSDRTIPSPGKVAFGQSIQFFSILFLALAAIAFVISFFNDFFSKDVPRTETAPVPPAIDQSRPAPPPPPKKRKYTERDFMPAALRAELDAKEAQAAPPPPPPPPAKTVAGSPPLRAVPGAAAEIGGTGKAQ